MTSTAINLKRDLKEVTDAFCDEVMFHRMQAMMMVSEEETIICTVSRTVDHPDYYRAVINRDRGVIEFFIGTTYEESDTRKLVWGELPDWGYDPKSGESPYVIGKQSIRDFLSDYEGVDNTPVNCW